MHPHSKTLPLRQGRPSFAFPVGLISRRGEFHCLELCRLTDYSTLKRLSNLGVPETTRVPFRAQAPEHGNWPAPLTIQYVQLLHYEIRPPSKACLPRNFLFSVSKAGSLSPARNSCFSIRVSARDSARSSIFVLSALYLRVQIPLPALFRPVNLYFVTRLYMLIKILVFVFVGRSSEYFFFFGMEVGFLYSTESSKASRWLRWMLCSHCATTVLPQISCRRSTQICTRMIASVRAGFENAAL